ncbi:DUF4123 domain-containing protein [Klebsiella pneumoniae subsp. pneumoniae]|nr:DUF4123 domain-containing protein [Klebsiella pneumoniae subsp. pneumoniae]
MSSDSFSLAAQHLIYSTKVTLYALVDGLQYERYFGEGLSAPQPAAMPLFDTWPDSRIAFAGPWIIQMSCAMDISEKLCHLETALPSVSWILSSSALTEQVVHLKNNMNVGLPDGRAALLRFQGSTRSGSSGNDAERPATPEADRFNAGMVDNSGRESLVI